MNTDLINQLLAEPREQQWLEFKDSYYEPHVLGEYLSALANAACLAGRDQGYLLFGVDDATHQIVGTTFRPGKKKVKKQPLEFWLNQLLQPKVGLDIEAGEIDGKTVVLFAVGAAKGEPVRFNGVAYVRIDSCKTQLKNHPEPERRIWTRGAPDWSAQTPAGATLNHLDPIALKKARDEYRQKNRHAAFQGEIESWDELTFLSKARLAVEGRLTNANLNMIDTIGSGIKRMFVTQKRRFLPMPDYDLSQPEEVRMRLAGRVLDENYTKLLIRQTDLTLDQAILLDKVQKGVRIGKDAHGSLKKAGLVEGRFPNLLVSAQVAAATGKKVDYIRRRGQDDVHYERLVLDFLKEFGSGTREEFDDLLMDKLPDVLSEDQKRRRIGNLLSVRMRRRGGLVENQGSRSQPRWVLTAKGRKNT